ncbi:MAG: hypothetical protein Q7U54_18230 [Bacteroidales bacterium]|nr:hypothetical protein [Bacteroidales bacterium]
MKYKNITYLFILITLASSSLFFIGCETLDNTIGDDLRDPFVGDWMFLESFKSTESQSYMVTISKDPNNSSQVILENFANAGQGITATGIATSTQIVVSSQVISNGWTVNGSGKTDNTDKTIMSWTLSVEAGGTKDDFTATATLQ